MLLFKLSFDIFFTLQSYCLEKTKVKRNGQKVCKTPIKQPKIVVIRAFMLIFYHKTLDNSLQIY